MIFLTVGSQKFQFNRLIRAVDELVAAGAITEEVFAQIGASDYIPQHFQYQAYLDRGDFEKMIGKCDVVITHGGTGSMLGAIKAGKKVIAIPRLVQYGEHVDDHQRQLVGQFIESNLVCSCEDLDDLAQILKDVKTHEFAIYKSNTSVYLKTIDDYLKSVESVE